MSYNEWSKYNHAQDQYAEYEKSVLEQARRTREMLKGSEITLIELIDYNAATNAKPFHMNREPMHTLLRMEQND